MPLTEAVNPAGDLEAELSELFEATEVQYDDEASRTFVDTLCTFRLCCA